jgi:hypothetical protein
MLRAAAEAINAEIYPLPGTGSRRSWSVGGIRPSLQAAQASGGSRRHQCPADAEAGKQRSAESM